MNQRSVEDRLARVVPVPAGADRDQDASAKQDAAVDHALRLLEDQLATIIASARGIAVAAEELLRDVSQSTANNDGRAERSVPHAIAVAPRLLAATEQQLLSVKAMLRKL